MLDVIDDEEFHRCASRLELQAELLLKCGEDRWAVGSCRAGVANVSTGLFRLKLEREVVDCGQARAVDDGTVDKSGKRRR